MPMATGGDVRVADSRRKNMVASYRVSISPPSSPFSREWKPTEPGPGRKVGRIQSNGCTLRRYHPARNAAKTMSHA